MRRRYIKGSPDMYALGQCQRSGKRKLLSKLVSDGHKEGMLVDPRWREKKLPSEKIRTFSDMEGVIGGSGDKSHVGYQVSWPSYDVENDVVINSKLDRDLIGTVGVSVS